MSDPRKRLNRLAWLLFSFRGRVSRPAYICCQLASMPLTGFYFRAIVAQQATATPSPVAQGLLTLWGFFLVWIGAAVLAKRLHDLNWRGWWALLFPPLGLAWVYLPWAALALLAVLPPRPGAGRFGPAPLSLRELLALHKISSLDRAFAAGRMTAEEFNARRAEILKANETA